MDKELVNKILSVKNSGKIEMIIYDDFVLIKKGVFVKIKENGVVKTELTPSTSCVFVMKRDLYFKIYQKYLEGNKFVNGISINLYYDKHGDKNIFDGYVICTTKKIYGKTLTQYADDLSVVLKYLKTEGEYSLIKRLFK